MLAYPRTVERLRRKHPRYSPRGIPMRSSADSDVPPFDDTNTFASGPVASGFRPSRKTLPADEQCEPERGLDALLPAGANSRRAGGLAPIAPNA
jgi:hypothetical protein